SDDIAFWHLLSGPDGVTMGEMLDGYMATDGAADVTQTVLAWGAPYYTKLAMASAGGRAPDLAVMHAARVPGDRKSTRLNSSHVPYTTLFRSTRTTSPSGICCPDRTA